MQLSELAAWVDSQTDEMEAALKQMVNINTFTANTEGVDEGMGVLKALAVGMGFTVETVNERHLLIKSGNGKGPRVLLITHMDTVHAPDNGFTEYKHMGDGFVTGPGVGDIKGGTIIGLWSMKALADILTDYDVQMVVSADEEKGSPSIKAWYGDRSKHGADYAIGLEPGFPQGELSASVDLGVVYQRRGYSAITFTVTGKASHSGTPEKGLSAIEAIAHKIVKLQALNDWKNGVSVNVGLVDGGTAANTVPEAAKATVSFRYERLDDGLRTREAVERVIMEPVISNDALGLTDHTEYQLDTFLAPMERTEESQKLVDIVLEEAKALGQPVVPIARGGGSDANHVSGSGVPSICGMGAPAQGIHTLQEKIYLPMLFERVKLLTRTLYRIYQG